MNNRKILSDKITEELKDCFKDEFLNSEEIQTLIYMIVVIITQPNFLCMSMNLKDDNNQN